ncbi:MAG TPA: RNA polymerase sigma-70 factor [Pseudosphingobacterium sp.]|nr:RNA polymerase sigma-70 factor [Pseudosphingobacterium sp.]
METKTDAQLLAGINRRSIAAFDALFHKYYKLLCGYAFLFLKDEENAKDIVQNLFVEIWEKRRFEYLEGNVMSYLYKSVHNRCLNYIRNNETKLRRQLDYEEYTRETHHATDHELREQVYKRLETNLDRLPKQRREAISLVYLEDKKYQDVANAMGISINSLKTHLKIGLKNLRDKIKKRS